MALTKKHYKLIAEAIVEARKTVERESGNSIIVKGANCGFYELAKILSNEFGMDNPRFDENAFMVATETLHN
jgi:hypothetical protein